MSILADLKASKPINYAEFRRNPPERKPDWIPGFLPRTGGKMLVGGSPKVGKSLILFEIIRSIITGDKIFGRDDCKCEKAKVLYVGQEAKDIEIYDRCGLIFGGVSDADAQNYDFILRQPQCVLDTDAGAEFLAGIIAQCDANIVVLDPMQDFIQGDENSSTAIGKAFHNIDIIMKHFEDRELSVIMAHHFKKADKNSDNYDPLDPENFRGSGRWWAWVDSAMMCHRTSLSMSELWWKNKVRWRGRHRHDPEDFYLNINQGGSLECRLDNNDLKRRPFTPMGRS